MAAPMPAIAVHGIFIGASHPPWKTDHLGRVRLAAILSATQRAPTLTVVPNHQNVANAKASIRAQITLPSWEYGNQLIRGCPSAFQTADSGIAPFRRIELLQLWQMYPVPPSDRNIPHSESYRVSIIARLDPPLLLWLSGGGGGGVAILWPLLEHTCPDLPRQLPRIATPQLSRVNHQNLQT